MRLLWSRQAEDDAASIVEFIARDKPGAAIEIGDAIEEHARRLRDFPKSGRRGRVKGTRELVVAGSPFILVYRILGDTIGIVRVLHGAQQWPPPKR